MNKGTKKQRVAELEQLVHDAERRVLKAARALYLSRGLGRGHAKELHAQFAAHDKLMDEVRALVKAEEAKP